MKHMGRLTRVFLISKKQALVALACLVVLSAIFASIFLPRTFTNTLGSEEAKALTAEERQLLEDNDRDGLENWQEALWNTDPKNPDSDGDGEPDGKEVEEGADPTVKGKGNSGSALPYSTDNNLTAELTKMVVETGGFGSLDQGEAPRLTNDYIEKVGTSYAQALAIYTNDGLKTLRYSAASDEASIKQYLNVVATLYQTILGAREPGKNEFQIMQTVSKDPESPAAQKELALIAKSVEEFQKMWFEIRKLEAPNEIRSFHERQATLLLSSTFELQRLHDFNKDPASALVAIYGRLSTRIALSKLYDEDLARWLREKKISFADKEPASQMFGW